MRRESGKIQWTTILFLLILAYGILVLVRFIPKRIGVTSMEDWTREYARCPARRVTSGEIRQAVMNHAQEEGLEIVDEDIYVDKTAKHGWTQIRFEIYYSVDFIFTTKEYYKKVEVEEACLN